MDHYLANNSLELSVDFKELKCQSKIKAVGKFKQKAGNVIFSLQVLWNFSNFRIEDKFKFDKDQSMFSGKFKFEMHRYFSVMEQCA